MKKFLSVLVLTLVILPLVSACKDTPEVVSDGGSGTSNGETQLVKKDLDQREINVLCWDFGYGSKSILGFSGEVLYNDDEKTSTAVDKAKAEVIRLVEQDYNCKIGGLMYQGDHTGFTDTINKMVLADTHEYDIIFESYGNLTTLATNDRLLDLTSINTIDFDNSWWDQNAKNDLSIYNKLYFMVGDINTYDNDGTWCMLFNKTLLQKLNLGIDPYKLVENDEWTFDRFVQICKTNDITNDSNSDGVLDEKDTWAFGTETYNAYVHVLGGGEKIVQKNAEDEPYFTYQTESTASALRKIVDFYLDKQTVMVANMPPYTEKGFPNVWESTVHKAFVEGRELFYMCGLINIASFRSMEDDFGIVPIPKMSDTQDQYYHTVSTGNMTALSVPVNVKDADDLGLVIEALGMYSQKYVTPEYIERQLKYRDTRDDESAAMLDIIFNSRIFDLGAAYNWGGVRDVYTSISPNFASSFTSISGTAQSALEETLEKYKNG